MLNLRILAVVLAFGSGDSPAASAQDRTERVTFASGATGTTMAVAIRGPRGVNYALAAFKAQRMSVDTMTSNPSA